MVFLYNKILLLNNNLKNCTLLQKTKFFFLIWKETLHKEDPHPLNWLTLSFWCKIWTFKEQKKTLLKTKIIPSLLILKWARSNKNRYNK